MSRFRSQNDGSTFGWSVWEGDRQAARGMVEADARLFAAADNAVTFREAVREMRAAQQAFRKPTWETFAEAGDLIYKRLDAERLVDTMLSEMSRNPGVAMFGEEGETL